MGYADALTASGYKKEVPSDDMDFTLKGTYKAAMVAAVKMDGEYGASIYGQFKVVETLDGKESKSSFPEFKQYFKLDDATIGNKKRGLAKLLDGFFGIGKDIVVDDNLEQTIIDLIGTELYIKAWKGKKFAPDGVDEAGKTKFKEAGTEQKWAFLSKEDATKAKKSEAKAEATPF